MPRLSFHFKRGKYKFKDTEERKEPFSGSAKSSPLSLISRAVLLSFQAQKNGKSLCDHECKNKNTQNKHSFFLFLSSSELLEVEEVINRMIYEHINQHHP